MWLALGNHTPSSDPPLAKGTEAAFSPKMERSPGHLELLLTSTASEISKEENNSPANDGRGYAQITPSPQENFFDSKTSHNDTKTFDFDNSLPTEQQISEQTGATQNDKGSTTLLQEPHVSGKKPRVAIAMGAVAALVIGGFYVWVLAPEKIPLSPAAEFTEMIKSTANKVKSLATERSGESMEVAKNVTSKVPPSTVEKDENEAAPKAPAENHRSESSISQEVQDTTVANIEPQEDSDQSSLSTPIIGLPAQAKQQREQNTTISEAKEENPSGISPNAEVATLLAQAEQQMANFKFTTPKGNNAYETYTKILTIAPNHPAVASGLQRIRDYYVSWGLKAESQRQLSLATTYYKRALSIFPEDFALRTALRRVQAQRENR
jgi:hypothetical protein